MNTEETYSSKVDWWIPAIVIFSVGCCLIGPMIDGDFIPGIILCICVLIIELFIFTGVKYKISGAHLGIRNFYHWSWFPINKISEVKKTRGILSAAALSLDRISIKFSDKKILKSSMPLEISPKDRDLFISRLKEINPAIIVRHI